MAKKIVVNLTDQTVTAYEGNGTVFHTCECVSGDSSHPTPVGTFHINRKQHPYSSHKYGSAMNYAMFFTNTGEALHQYQGPSPWWFLRAGRSMTSWFGSHGCVRLQESDAATLYGWAPIRTRVVVS